MSNPFWIALANHLWQSTLFGLCIALLTLFLRRNSATVRSALWLAGSVKFLVPFSWLAALGAQIPWPWGHANEGASTFGMIISIGDIVAPVAQFAGQRELAVTRVAEGASPVHWILLVLAAVWILGTLLFLARWLRAFMRVRHALRDSTLTGIDFVIPVRSSVSQLEPGVVGIFRPVLLLPAGLEQRLAPEQMRAVLAHERCHVARRDNLAAAIHMLVEALFWFHPLVWWLGARLIEERERACDEYVLGDGHEAETYAAGILTVCQHYVESRLPCVAGVSGADLKARIEAIMKKPVIAKLNGARKVALAVVGSAALAGPLFVGALTSPQVRAAAPAGQASAAEYRTLSIALSAQPDGPVQFRMERAGRDLHIANVSVASLLMLGYEMTERQLTMPEALKTTHYDIDVEMTKPLSGMPMDANKRLIRKLLADQFGVTVEHERKTLDGYVLMVSSSGSKLKPYSGLRPEHTIRMTPSSIEGTGVGINELTRALAQWLRAPVVDETGAAGAYDYTVTWKPEPQRQLPPKGPAAFVVEPGVLTQALQEQLGLHLEARPVSVDTLEVVSAKQPEEVVTKLVATK